MTDVSLNSWWYIAILGIILECTTTWLMLNGIITVE